MLTVVVHLAAHPERPAAFRAGIRADARATVRDEPGGLRSSVHQQVGDRTRVPPGSRVNRFHRPLDMQEEATP